MEEATLNQFETVDLKAFVNASTDRDRATDECVTVVPQDDGGLSVLRLTESVTEDAGENVRIRYEFENPRFSTNGRSNRETPGSITYHHNEAATILTWLRALLHERSDAIVYASYWAENDSPMITGAGLHNETLTLRYKTETGREQVTSIHSPYETTLQMCASF